MSANRKGRNRPTGSAKPLTSAATLSGDVAKYIETCITSDATVQLAGQTQLLELQVALENIGPVTHERWGNEFAAPFQAALLRSQKYKGEGSLKEALARFKVATIALSNKCEIKPEHTSMRKFNEAYRDRCKAKGWLPKGNRGGRPKTGKTKTKTGKVVITREAALTVLAKGDKADYEMLDWLTERMEVLRVAYQSIRPAEQADAEVTRKAA